MEQKYGWKEMKLVGKVMHDGLIMLCKSFLWLNWDLSLKTFRNCDREVKNFIYRADKSRTKFLGLWVTLVYFKILSRSGIHQGSTKLYQKQPIPGKYDRGHLVPVNILRYSDESARATFTYTNCVPQIKGFNRGVWKTYEQKIDKYARRVCSPNGGTLYLITGTSQVKFNGKLNLQGEIIGVDESVEQMEEFHGNVDEHQKIAIPNSMWTVGCCLNLNTNQVVGAFGVMGDNSLGKKLLNEFIMSGETVADVEWALKLEDPKIELFPNGKDCYDKKKNVQLNEVRSYLP